MAGDSLVPFALMGRVKTLAENIRCALESDETIYVRIRREKQDEDCETFQAAMAELVRQRGDPRYVAAPAALGEGQLRMMACPIEPTYDSDEALRLRFRARLDESNRVVKETAERIMAEINRYGQQLARTGTVWH